MGIRFLISECARGKQRWGAEWVSGKTAWRARDTSVDLKRLEFRSLNPILGEFVLNSKCVVYDYLMMLCVPKGLYVCLLSC